ncbi:hypothetical protein OG792_02590 [Micromonospora sp. NBC_01699]|uniref:hypothetical protein n=1 Tax=Micromonospora sp. NBC_01699 TaxID=2975984 RepID=UPI002E2C4C3D|nr:hypothetical protein [Micromonospora sp. NBC_01699]
MIHGLRRATVTVAAVAVAAGLLSGCGQDATGPGASAPATAAPNPKETLLAAVPDETRPGFAYTIKDWETTLTGEVAPEVKGTHLRMSYKEPSMGFTMHMAYLTVDKDTWTKISFTDTKGLTGLPKLPAKWMLLDPAKLTSADAVPTTWSSADVADLKPLLANTTITESGGGKYAGTVDLSGAVGTNILAEETAAGIGEAAKTLPFQATVDAEGRLTSLVVNVPAVGKTKAYDYSVTYADYGSAPPVAAPAAADAVPAPAAAYELINA